MLCGARSFAAIVEWIAGPDRASLALTRTTPAGTTLCQPGQLGRGVRPADTGRAFVGEHEPEAESEAERSA